MQRQELIKAIQGPPSLRVGKRLARYLSIEPETEKPCLNLDCFNFHTNEKYCSQACGNVMRGRNVQPYGARAIGDKRRGCNPNRHIAKRVNGKLLYLHRVIVSVERGFIPDDAIVHHRDANKHHNCYGSQLCELCTMRFFVFLSALRSEAVYVILCFGLFGFSNLELLEGEAARKHIAQHQRQLQAARKAKRK